MAKVTDADVAGLEIGSKTLDFRPNRGPADLVERNINIRAESPAASALLIFQAVFPFLLFAGNESNEPVELTISGGTNVSFSFSFEYLDQVLLPTMKEWFGVMVERKLESRGWSSGSASRGSIWFKILPLQFGSTLKLKKDPYLGLRAEDFDVKAIDITIITPTDIHNALEDVLKGDLNRLFPDISLNFREPEESKHESRIYVLLVAKSETLRWGRDILYGGKRKKKTREELCKEVSRAVTKALGAEIRQGGVVDEFLQDQLVIFQALAQGKTSFPRSTTQAERDSRGGQSAAEIDEKLNELHIDEELRKDRVKGPLGDPEMDSSHTSTARWVTAEILEPQIKWYNKGAVCEGLGLISGNKNVAL